MIVNASEPMFSFEDLALLQRAASRVWNEIACDILQAVADERKQRIEAVSIPRAEVIELVLDADRLTEELRRSRVDPDLITRFEGITPEARVGAIKPAFTYGRYGM